MGFLPLFQNIKKQVIHCGNWQEAIRQDKQKLVRGVSEGFYMQELVTYFRTYTPPFLALYFGPQWLDGLNLLLKKQQHDALMSWAVKAYLAELKKPYHGRRGLCTIC